MKHYSISQLAKKFGLSRSTLLYYDSIDLLKSTIRTDANYRIYTDKDHERLQRICSLRSTGISLEHIREIIDSNNTSVAGILQKRINHINNEIQNLRFQQTVIVKLLGDAGLLKSTRIITKDVWVALLKSAGLDENGMRQWHMEFEKSMPEGHQDFLESLGLCAEEISTIRDWSKKNGYYAE
jgi:MerR family transcriptional regulator, thiopeptide resistance regulator